jgi:Flp pilus assembly protein TadD
MVPEYSAFQSILMPVYSFMFYIFKLIVPTGLAIIHPYPDPSAIPPIYYVAFVLFIVLVIFTLRSIKKYPEWVFGIGFYFVCILPVLQLIPVGQAVAAERYFYVSSIGLMYIVGFGFNHLLTKKTFGVNVGKSSWALLVIIIPILAYLTNQRTRDWESGLTIWKSQTEAYPDHHRGYYGVGLHHYNLKDYPVAISWYRQCLDRNPANVKALNNLGNCYQHQNNPDSAYYCYQALLAVDTNYANVYVNLGNIYLRRQEYDNAINSYKKAIAINNNFGMAYYGLGIVLETVGEQEEAIKNYIHSARLGFGMAQDVLKNRNISY